jgi:hypothetical protein
MEWYEFQAEILGREKVRVLGGLPGSDDPTDSRFFGMTRGEVEVFFSQHHDELECVAILSIMTAAEAAIRMDYRNRVKERLKDPVSRRFRAIDRRKLSQGKKADRLGLEEEILNAWATEAPTAKSPVNDFKGALKLRHWLAHGRYWRPKLGRQEFSPGDVFDISNTLLDIIDVYVG